MLGNLLADFVKGNGEVKFPEEVVEGIRNHREVDTYTDSNDIVSLSRKLISKSRCLYSGVIIDVVYDHFLSRNWGLYSSTGLDEFIGTVYENLSNRTVRIPQIAGLIVKKMIKEDWLRSYKTMEGIDKTFKRISKRMRGENNLWTAVDELEVNNDSLNTHFLHFFPQLLKHLRGSGPSKLHLPE
jgi:acyl carrier protein phosphodiesterase